MQKERPVRLSRKSKMTGQLVRRPTSHHLSKLDGSFLEQYGLDLGREIRTCSQRGNPERVVALSHAAVRLEEKLGRRPGMQWEWIE